MSDYVEMLRELKAAQREQKERSRVLNTAMIEHCHGVKCVESRNGGVHLMVTANNGRRIDVWPSTGKWMVQGEKDQAGRQKVRHGMINATIWLRQNA